MTMASATRKRLTAGTAIDAAGKLIEGFGQHDGELKSEQGLGAGQDNPRLGQQLLDLDLQRRISPFVALAPCDHALPLPDKSLAELR